jgi:hypothetical protein
MIYHCHTFTKAAGVFNSHIISEYSIFKIEQDQAIINDISVSKYS